MKLQVLHARTRKVNGLILKPAAGMLVALALLFLAGCGVFGRPAANVGPPPANLDTAALMQTGQQVYQDKCAKCHGLDGLGIPGIYEGFANDPTVIQPDAGPVVQIVLFGKKEAPTFFNYRNQMASFSFLTDQQIAAVVTYIRNSWGNQASAVSPAQVAAVRKAGD